MIQQEARSPIELVPVSSAGTTGGFGGRLAGIEDDELKTAVGEVIGLGNDPGLGLLLDLAKRGEYDPWNVDIVAVTDSYLNALDENLDAQGLRRVARLIFYAAALIHLKAKALAARQKSLDYEAALEQAFADEFGDDTGAGFPRLHPGDQPLDYGFLSDGMGGGSFGPQERPVRDRGLSLVDLIVALREYDERLAEQEQAWEEPEPAFDGAIAYEECVGGSHQEDLGQDLADVRLELWTTLAETKYVTLKSLVTERRSQASTYLALLFLAQDEEVYLEQPQYYGELRIVKGPFFGEIRAGVLDEDEEDEESEGGEA